MNPGHCGFLSDEPDWYDQTEYEQYCTVVPDDDDGVCFIDECVIGVGRYIKSDLLISLGDAR